MATEASPAHLVVEIRNHDPVELADLTASLQAFARQYQRFSSRNEIVTQEQAKLYVSDMRSGSILATLVPYVAVAAPFVSNTKDLVELSGNVLQFAGYLKNGFEWLIGRRAQSDAERQYTVTDIRELSQILETTAKDHEGSFVVKAYGGFHPANAAPI
jgi:hypothetical protein